MDTIRQIRFATPAFFFVGILVLGQFFDSPPSVQSLKDLQPAAVVAVIGAMLAAMFPLGFVIGAVTSLALRAAFWICGGRIYQIALSDRAWRNVWRVLRLNEDLPATPPNKVYAAMTFDHEILADGVHSTSVRLWSAFNIAANSAVAILLGCVVNHLWLHIRWTQAWVGVTVVLELVLVAVAVITWREHMGLLEFQSHRLGRAGRMPHQNRSDRHSGDDAA